MPGRGSGHTSGGRAVEFRVPARTEALAVVRAMTSCLADYEGLDGETAANLALAVDEACTVLIGMSAPGAALVVEEDPHAHELTVRISAVCDSVHGDPGTAVLSGFSRRVLQALTERVETFVDDTDFERTAVATPALGIALTVRRRWAMA
ncbi:hypothetical protein BKG60_23425 [Mycobacterium syngnathidarum]|nr:hypothetical protein BKG60_23425 [Mycobacterium syngnathidarum]